MLPNIGLTGRKRSGKDTVADYLVQHHQYVRVGLADPLKALALRLDPFIRTGDHGVMPLAEAVHVWGWEVVKDRFPDARIVLQRLGTEVIREGIDDRAWIRLCIARVREFNAAGVPAVVPDVRFPNEGQLLAELVGARLWRVTRDQAGALDPHPSEQHAENIPVDRELQNWFDIDHLHRRVEHAVNEMRSTL